MTKAYRSQERMTCGGEDCAKDKTTCARYILADEDSANFRRNVCNTSLFKGPGSAFDPTYSDAPVRRTIQIKQTDRLIKPGQFVASSIFSLGSMQA